jgi:hypothetical protein
MAALKPKVRQDLVAVDIDSEAVVYDPEEALLHHLNPTAAVVFKLCDGSGTIRELSEDIAEVLGMPFDTVQRQVRRVVSQFKREGLLEGHSREIVEQIHRHSEHRHGDHNERLIETEEQADGRSA